MRNPHPAERVPYKTDLTDAQWEIIRPLIPPPKPGGRPRAVDMREVLNTLLYQARTGCQWELLPHDLLPKSTVYDYSFDALNRSAPSFFVLGGRGNNWQSKTIAATSFVGGYLALACYSSP